MRNAYAAEYHLKLELNSAGLSVQIVENQNRCCCLHKKKKKHILLSHLSSATFELYRNISRVESQWQHVGLQMSAFVNWVAIISKLSTVSLRAIAVSPGQTATVSRKVASCQVTCANTLRSNVVMNVHKL